MIGDGSCWPLWKADAFVESSAIADFPVVQLRLAEAWRPGESVRIGFMEPMEFLNLLSIGEMMMPEMQGGDMW